MSQNGQTHFKNLAAFAAKFLKCVWPFWDIMQRFNQRPLTIFAEKLHDGSLTGLSFIVNFHPCQNARQNGICQVSSGDLELISLKWFHFSLKYLFSHHLDFILNTNPTQVEGFDDIFFIQVTYQQKILYFIKPDVRAYVLRKTQPKFWKGSHVLGCLRNVREWMSTCFFTSWC